MNRFYLLAVGLLLAFSLSAQLSPGDIAITYYQSDNDDVAGFVATTTIPGGTEILITDNGWLSSGAFRGGEGIVQFTVPAAGLNCGDEFFFIDGVFPTVMAHPSEQLIIFPVVLFFLPVVINCSCIRMITERLVLSLVFR